MKQTRGFSDLPSELLPKTRPTKTSRSKQLQIFLVTASPTRRSSDPEYTPTQYQNQKANQIPQPETAIEHTPKTSRSTLSPYQTAYQLAPRGGAKIRLPAFSRKPYPSDLRHRGTTLTPRHSTPPFEEQKILPGTWIIGIPRMQLLHNFASCAQLLDPNFLFHLLIQRHILLYFHIE
ncbi:hypothetical protein FF1_008867 [Malus domestica]